MILAALALASAPIDLSRLDASPVEAPTSPASTGDTTAAPTADSTGSLPQTQADANWKTVDPPPGHHAPGDPLEKFNRRMFAAHQRFDKALLRPAALGYRHAVPKPVRGGLRHALSNLGEPIVFLNFLLQLKPGKAAETLGRFAINSTLGVGGLIDVAKRPPFHLPHRANGLGDTLALYGVGPGPYLFLPLVGPTTLRDLVGGQGDALLLPIAVGKPFDSLEYQLPRALISGLDQRAEADDELTTLFAGAIDPYATLRSVYLQNRAAEIDGLRGHHAQALPNPPELDDPLTDPDAARAAAGDAATADAPPPAPQAQIEAFTPLRITSAHP